MNEEPTMGLSSDEDGTLIQQSVSQSVSLLHSHIDKVVNMQTKYIELYLRVYVYVC